MATIVVAHGAWSAGWAWKKMHPLMAARGHTFLTPTYSGQGERSHQAHPGIELATHIEDLLQVLHFWDLRDVVLIGHSYGGMVATGVAAAAADRISRLIYLDAFAPRDGEAVFTIMMPETAERLRAAAAANDGWRIPSNPMPPDTPPEDVAWAAPRRVPQPILTFERPLQFAGPLRVRPHYIYCTRIGPGDSFRSSYEKAQRENWGHSEMDASHNPHITAPEALAARIDEILLEPT